MLPRCVLLGLCCLLLMAVPHAARGCIGCWDPPTGLSQDIAQSNVVVIVELVKPVPLEEGCAIQFLAPSKFRVVRFLKGKSTAVESQYIDVQCTHPGEVGDFYLLLGVGPGMPRWFSPRALGEEGIEYLELLSALPQTSSERLYGLLPYLGDENPLIANDVADEFSAASYQSYAKLRPYLDRQQLVSWITDLRTTRSNRRVYLDLLCVCGNENDLPLLEELMFSEEPRFRANLDGIFACYLALKGEDGLPLIEDSFLRSHRPQDLAAQIMLTGTMWQPIVGPAVLEAARPEYVDLYSAIMALRFHAHEADCIEESRIVESLRIVLERPALADLVIPDLARLEDWDSMDKLFTLYANATSERNWIRVPVILYLRQCPLPQAQTYLEECAAIDPMAVRRADWLVPPAAPADTPE